MGIFDRRITTKINWMLENAIPACIRDNKKMMRFIIRFAYGKYTDDVMEFKERYPYMSEKEIDALYEKIVDAPINKKRQTDLNEKCVDYILNHVSGRTVLDAASGRGYMVKKLLSGGYESIGLDVAISDKQIETGYFLQGRLEKIPLEDNSFETVICTHALEHIRDYKKAVSEIMRVASKRIIIVMPKQREYLYTPDLHVNFCPYLYRFKAFLIESGVPEEASFFELGGDFVCDFHCGSLL